ncbi:MAG: hypothetical protein RJA22_485 [Verrucomicrobiota bacterium]|jgi:hypothetical protein
MKFAVLLGLRGSAAFFSKGRTLKHGILALFAAGFLSFTTSAHAISQLEFIQWMVQLSGDNSMFSAGSTADDYVTWARAKGMNPTGGWTPTSALTPDQLAQALVQLYGLNPRKFNGDYFRILEREGIYIDRNAVEVSRSALASLVDEFGFQSRLFLASNASTSKGLGWLVQQPGNNPGRDGAPPPGFQNPRNPNFGNQNPRNNR